MRLRSVGMLGASQCCLDLDARIIWPSPYSVLHEPLLSGCGCWAAVAEPKGPRCHGRRKALMERGVWPMRPPVACSTVMSPADRTTSGLLDEEVPAWTWH